MAERRMFAKTIIDSDAFLDMPVTARLLYYDLAMRADDDGFVNSPKKVMRIIGAAADDMNILLARKFVIAFESGVVVIKHWRIHNYIAKDRYTETKYKEEKSLLHLDDNNAYTLGNGILIDEITDKKKKPLTPAQQKRLDAKKESELPYSFEYKIRNAFVGHQCPICGCTMSYENKLVKPTVQHNKPISLGGKHELTNISVICNSCNSSVQNREETPPYNTDEVISIWECIENVSGMSTQDRLGKDRLGKDRLGKDRLKEKEKEKEKSSNKSSDVVKKSSDKEKPHGFGGKSTKVNSIDEILESFNNTFSPEVETAIMDWISYKNEKRQGYKPQGLKSLLTQIKKHCDESGDKAVVDVMTLSMSNNWQGIIWDKLKQSETTKAKKQLQDEMEMGLRWLKGGQQ